MSKLTKAERLRLTAAILYPEDADERLSVQQVAELTFRDPQVVKHYIRKGVLPATLEKGKYQIEARHIAVLLFQPAWGETVRVKPADKRLRHTVLPEGDLL